ncbi:MAG: DNA starvation/stationary phase protection protein [Rickettsiaceae bacterium]
MDKKTEELVEKLHNVLVNSYALYVKTQSYHWNVTGKDFYAMHLLFETQYREQAEAIDKIAEHIRTLGAKVDAGFEYFGKEKSITSPNKDYNLAEMLRDLINSQTAVIKGFDELSNLAVEHGDKATEDLARQRITAHKDQKWMLVSSSA